LPGGDRSGPLTYMEKRTILAVALSVLVFIAFQWYQQKYMAPEKAGRPSEISTQVQNESQATEQSAKPAAAEAVPSQSPVTLEAEDTLASQRKLVVDGPLYRAVLDNRGGVLTGWELKKYKSAQGRVFEMIAAPRDSGARTYPGTLLFQDPAVTGLANSERYQVSIEGAADTGEVLSPPVTVLLKLKRGDLTVEKRYRFEKDNYVCDLSTTVEKGGKALDGRFLLGQDIGPEHEHLLGSSKLESVYFSGGKARREGPPKDPTEIKKIEPDVRWTGLDMQYFAIIAIPARPLAYFDIQKFPVKAMGLDGKEVDRDLLQLTVPLAGSLQTRLYLGPKKQSDLEAVKPVDVTGVINYGMFSIIVLPLLSALRWIYQFVHNYGYAIILLTLLLSLLLFPLRLKQMLSMKKMQVVQPKVKAIQEKYKRYKKTDPKRAEMNQEIMALYKEHNVNPLGGCLPLLLQFPLLLAFYSLLANSIELRQAPFIWWLHDLSAKDPYYVLPVIMGITMFISQKMTPMTPGTDPTQAKMMMIMPVVFTFMFFSVMSGLNLYFLCSNIFQIAFQKIAERWMGSGRSGDVSKS
jgi:YidC/Oxa1 family membrane protein insertase